MVLQNFTYYMIFGLPIIFYLGIFTLIFLLITATLGYLSTKGKIKIKYHKIFAITTVILAIIHGLLAILVRS